MIEKFAKSKIFYEKWEAEKCNALAKVKPPLLIKPPYNGLFLDCRYSQSSQFIDYKKRIAQ